MNSPKESLWENPLEKLLENLHPKVLILKRIDYRFGKWQYENDQTPCPGRWY